MCCSWLDIGETIKAVAPVFTASAACFGAYIGYRGLSKWHAETVGKRRVELAEQVLSDFYEAKDIIEAARSPGGFEHEGATRPPEDWETPQDTSRLNSYYRTYERLSNKSEFFAQLAAHRYRFFAVFGKERGAPYDELFKIRGEIIIAVRMLVTTYQQRDMGSLPENRKDWEKVIGWRAIEEDEIGWRLNVVIEQIETICRPIIQASLK